MVESLPSKQVVAGSSPVSRSTFYPQLCQSSAVATCNDTVMLNNLLNYSHCSALLLVFFSLRKIGVLLPTFTVIPDNLSIPLQNA